MDVYDKTLSQLSSKINGMQGMQGFSDTFTSFTDTTKTSKWHLYIIGLCFIGIIIILSRYSYAS